MTEKLMPQKIEVQAEVQRRCYSYDEPDSETVPCLRIAIDDSTKKGKALQ
jgi:hypothetical protein